MSKDIEKNNLDYLQALKRTMKSFQKRSPVFFSFQNDLSKLYIQQVDSMSILEFPIDYNIPVYNFISSIRDRIRAEMYPHMREMVVTEIEPDIEEISKEIEKTGEPFEVVFNRLKRVEESRRFIIDKIDTIGNKIVIVPEEDTDKIFIYKVKIPVVVFMKRVLKEKMSEEETFQFFTVNTELLEQRN